MAARFVKIFFLARFSLVGYFMQKTASALTPQLLLKKEKSKTSSYLLQTSLARKLWIIDSMRGVYLVHYSMTIWINNTPDVHRLQGDRRHQFDKENFNLREYQKTWLIVDPISVENQIQLEHVSPSLWDLLDRQSFCRWMKVQLSTRWAAGKGRLGRRSREFWQFRVGAGWSSTVAGSVLHQAWLKRVGLLWVVSMFVFLSDATQVVVVANTTWAAVALWGIPTSAAQCSFQTLLCCWCCGGGGDNGDDDDDNGFFFVTRPKLWPI